MRKLKNNIIEIIINMMYITTRRLSLSLYMCGSQMIFSPSVCFAHICRII